MTEIPDRQKLESQRQMLVIELVVAVQCNPIGPVIWQIGEKVGDVATIDVLIAALGEEANVPDSNV